MKKVVLVLVIISSIIIGGVLVGNYLANQDKKTEQAFSGDTVQQEANQSQTETSNQSPQKTNTSETYTLADVATHNSEDDCWIIISNGVYNVTDYINQHPGGASRIIAFCGKDATQAFQTQGGEGSHSSTAQSLKENYLIGQLAQ